MVSAKARLKGRVRVKVPGRATRSGRRRVGTLLSIGVGITVRIGVKDSVGVQHAQQLPSGDFGGHGGAFGPMKSWRRNIWQLHVAVLGHTESTPPSPLGLSLSHLASGCSRPLQPPEKKSTVPARCTPLPVPLLRMPQPSPVLTKLPGGPKNSTTRSKLEGTHGRPRTASIGRGEGGAPLLAPRPL